MTIEIIERAGIREYRTATLRVLAFPGGDAFITYLGGDQPSIVLDANEVEDLIAVLDRMGRKA